MQAAALFLVSVCFIAGCSKIDSRITLENPFAYPGSSVADGRLGSFGQNDTGDCFFLAALLALGQDADGRKLLYSTIRPAASGDGWSVVFPNFPAQTIPVDRQELENYRLRNSDGDGFSPPALGDPDVAILEIGADKFWKQQIKTEGLWDDVPMNALFLFSRGEQWLLLNRDRAKGATIADIDKYRRFAGNAVHEIPIATQEQANIALRRILADDTDGISMVLIDYSDYHAAAIVAIDFADGSYLTLDTDRNSLEKHDLDDLAKGLASARYALNYAEFWAAKKPFDRMLHQPLSHKRKRIPNSLLKPTEVNQISPSPPMKNNAGTPLTP